MQKEVLSEPLQGDAVCESCDGPSGIQVLMLCLDTVAESKEPVLQAVGMLRCQVLTRREANAGMVPTSSNGNLFLIHCILGLM